MSLGPRWLRGVDKVRTQVHMWPGGMIRPGLGRYARVCSEYSTEPELATGIALTSKGHCIDLLSCI